MYQHIIRAVFNEPMLIEPAKLELIADLVRLRATGGRVPQADIDKIVAANPQPAPRSTGSIKVINVFGVMAQRMDLLSEMSGGTSTERVAKEFREAVADSGVGSIVLNIDSPGGSVYGVQELADVIFQARGSKPIVAIANSCAASAAYYIATQADELVVTPSGEVGSLGVAYAHFDVSAANERAGVKVTYITGGRFKREANPDEPLGDEARDYIQSRVDTYYDMFVSAVARGRGVKAAAVRANYGEGRMVGAKDAVARGMADRVETLDETIARMQSGGRRSRGAAASDDEQLITADVAVRSEEPDTAPAPEGSESAADLERRRRRLRLNGHG